jgi:DNA-binding NarL/FixJ family response regulator
MKYRPRALKPSKREMEVVTLLAKGLGTKEIGVTLGVETDTVKTHIYNVSKKLHTDSRVSLIMHCIRAGYLECPCGGLKCA